MEKIRNYSFDYIKVIAIVSVLLLHCLCSVYFRIPQYSIDSNILLTIDALIRYCVPLFVLTSGALLLNEDKEFSTKDFYIKRVLPTAIVLLFWLIVYSIFYMCLKNQPFLDYFIAFKGTDSWHLWYLYMLIGLYLITPILRLFVKRENSKYVILVIVLGLVFVYFLSFMQHYIPDLNVPIEKLDSGFVGGYIPYYLAGWYIVNVGVNKKIKKISYIIGIISWIIVFVACKINIDVWQVYSTEKGVLTFFFSTALFIFLYNKKNIKEPNPIISFVGSRTFGVYIIHMLFVDTFVYFVLPFPRCGVNSYLYMLLNFLFSFTCSIVSAFILEKIPLVKKLVMK